MLGLWVSMTEPLAGVLSLFDSAFFGVTHKKMSAHMYSIE